MRQFRYDLPVDVVNDGLPLIDTTKTVIDHFCPARAKKSKCEGSLRFRSIDGTCNNIHHPQRGATSSPFRRLLPASYADGINVLVQFHLIVSLSVQSFTFFFFFLM